MDYTTLTRLQNDLDNKISGQETELSQCIADASRWIDHEVTGVGDDTCLNYFALESKTETLFGRLTNTGTVVVYPRKPFVASVQSMSWRLNPRFTLNTLNLGVNNDSIIIDGMRVECYDNNIWNVRPQEVMVQITYVGGLATSGSALSDNLQRTCSVMAIRLYREIKGGLTDAIGVAELGQLVYTKAVPLTVLKWLDPYRRKVGWRGSF
jgi:hypothetical protein